MIECVRGLDDISKYRRYRLLRPACGVVEDKKAWWLYAIQCHGLLMRHNCDSSNVAKENIKYIKLYTRMLANPNEMLAQDNKEFKEVLEAERSYEELRVLREICMLRMQPVAPKKPENAPKGR